jgi:hypothetical protein
VGAEEKKQREPKSKMGQPSFAASNAIIYVTYGFFLYVKLKHAARTENKQNLFIKYFRLVWLT